MGGCVRHQTRPCHRGSAHASRYACARGRPVRIPLVRYPTTRTTRGDLWRRQESDIRHAAFDAIDKASLRYDVPAFRAGDTVKVHVKVVEGTRSRVQVFQGVVIRRHGGGVGETFTVRKVSFGVGVERTFPLHTPIIDKIEVVTVVGTSVARSCTTCATCAARRRRSRRSATPSRPARARVPPGPTPPRRRTAVRPRSRPPRNDRRVTTSEPDTEPVPGSSHARARSRRASRRRWWPMSSSPWSSWSCCEPSWSSRSPSRAVPWSRP